MRECKQINCVFLKMKNGCRTCKEKECKASPFMVRDDCPTCWNCENIPNSCRWNDEDEGEIEEKQLQMVKIR